MNAIKDYYERIWAEKKEPIVSRWSHKDVVNLMKNIKPFLKAKCLDVGCGHGEKTSELNKIAPTIGVDISETAIKIAKKINPNIEFKQGSVTNLPFPNEEFSTIFAGELIEHVLDTEKMFSEFFRVLKKGGRLIIIYPEYNFLKSLVVAFFFSKHFSPTEEHIRFYTKRSLEQCLQQFGFKIFCNKRIETHFKLIPKLTLVVSRKQ